MYGMCFIFLISKPRDQQQYLTSKNIVLICVLSTESLLLLINSLLEKTFLFQVLNINELEKPLDSDCLNEINVKQSNSTPSLEVRSSVIKNLEKKLLKYKICLTENFSRVLVFIKLLFSIKLVIDS